MSLVIYHLYPDLLDLYGDRGNILALAARCRWREIDVQVRQVTLGDPLDLSRADILFLGGGSDREQSLLVEDLSRRAETLKDSVEDGLVILTICGGYQLLGEYYQTGEGRKIPGLGLLDLYTVAGNKRLIGNVIAETDEALQAEITRNGSENKEKELNTLVGFENHSGKTYLGSGLKPLAKVVRGYGNNGEDHLEGVRYRNVFGTYLHGPLLPKNPHLADLLIGLALERKGLEVPLPALNDTLERQAHQAVISRFKA
jgi:CobQ-like glutamine amidotransferase family enzyme